METMRSVVRRPGVVIAVFCFIAIACTSLVQKQDWSDRNGPVVPHASFPADCRLCHVGNGWSEIREDFEFDHAAETGVELTGAHARAACLRCHNDRGDVATFAARGCVGCHIDPHRGQLGTECQTCHNEQTWQPFEQIAMHDRTRMPLMGAHVAVACFRCHPGAEVGNFAGASPECLTCHSADLARALTPNHVANGWVDDCQRCHRPFSWKPAQFDHPSSFPLTLGHSGRFCSECHQPNVFSGLSPDCSSCHLGDAQAVRDPNHAAAGFSLDCTECHSTVAWGHTSFAHPNSFQISGAHVGLTCAECHVGNVYAGLGSNCIDCHDEDYRDTSSPDHQASGFPTDCTQCHSTFTWSSAAGFSHTAFPLTGSHMGVSCNECHVGNVYQGLPSNCIDCHDDDYRGTSNPDHQASAFPTDCTQCHSTVTWSGAGFSHTTFPLTGSHAGVTCNACHVGNVYQGLPSNCVDCHQAEYNATTNPPHAMQGFGTDCDTCHGTTTWQGAVFNHTFDIDSGDHAGFSCTDCHTTPGMPTAFSCTHCHDHRQSEMDDEHEDVGGYLWSSPSCFTCHPTGDD